MPTDPRRRGARGRTVCSARSSPPPPPAPEAGASQCHGVARGIDRATASASTGAVMSHRSPTPTSHPTARMSRNTNPSRSRPRRARCRSVTLKPGASHTKVWNSPCSPHGSTPSGSSARSASSKQRPANSAGSTPRVDAGEHRPHAGARSSRGRAVGGPTPQRKHGRDPGAGKVAVPGRRGRPRGTGRRTPCARRARRVPPTTAAAMRVSYTSLGHGEGISTTWSGRPRRSRLRLERGCAAPRAWRRGRLRRSPSRAGRDIDGALAARRLSSAYALSLPLLQLIHGAVAPRR